jgi:hypothetical protein
MVISRLEHDNRHDQSEGQGSRQPTRCRSAATQLRKREVAWLGLAQRDLVTAGLAKGDSGTVSAVKDLFQGALEAAQSGSK